MHSFTDASTAIALLGFAVLIALGGFLCAYVYPRVREQRKKPTFQSKVH